MVLFPALFEKVTFNRDQRKPDLFSNKSTKNDENLGRLRKHLKGLTGEMIDQSLHISLSLSCMDPSSFVFLSYFH